MRQQVSYANVSSRPAPNDLSVETSSSKPCSKQLCTKNFVQANRPARAGRHDAGCEVPPLACTRFCRRPPRLQTTARQTDVASARTLAQRRCDTNGALRQLESEPDEARCSARSPPLGNKTKGAEQWLRMCGMQVRRQCYCMPHIGLKHWTITR